MIIKKGDKLIFLPWQNLPNYNQEFHVLEKNNWVVLLRGGHGFEILEDCVLIEVKNGPYLASKDKIYY